MFFGYDVYAFVGSNKWATTSPYPHLIERVVVRPAASDQLDSTLPMVRAMATGRYPIRSLVADRAWSYKAPHRWLDHLQELGIEQVVDLHATDYGVRDHEGLKIVAGWPHCPAMPDDPIDIPRSPRLRLPDGTTIDEFPDEDGSESTAALETLRISRKWNANTGLSDDPLLQPDPFFYGWREVTSD